MVSGRYVPASVYWFRGLGEHRLAPRQVLLEAAEGEKYSMATTNVADFDGDGRLDLVIGDTSGSVFWSRNEGTAKEPRFRSRAPLRLTGDGEPIRVSHKSDPHAVDFDGDGAIDLLVGDEVADVSFFRGAGDGKFHQGVSLFSGIVVDSRDKYAAAKKKLEPHRVIPGYRLRVTTVDWNLDGKLDLLIGNCEEAEGAVGPDGKKQRGATIGHVYVLLRK